MVSQYNETEFPTQAYKKTMLNVIQYRAVMNAVMSLWFKETNDGFLSSKATVNFLKKDSAAWS
jgi:hypothetical protein